ncbi:hypothetical protein BCV69DRAFT_131300 [Microstroma glucosiphilum]|uniref:Uncharacterized protein n=1 Tax=Pseudomicrostroma glucosiphilum TaxID=1684307 RepID=A0A316TZ93_9BASI|nr:hypothetical protein BCV69DRAFT_131300 [Pseudomicrostroma glucosiphilum]PWN17651.1 hypothetical protein BCV69DRAFT_131300 [Pseudomicrostroma glucosiphilum]
MIGSRLSAPRLTSPEVASPAQAISSGEKLQPRLPGRRIRHSSARGKAHRTTALTALSLCEENMLNHTRGNKKRRATTTRQEARRPFRTYFSCLFTIAPVQATATVILDALIFLRPEKHFCLLRRSCLARPLSTNIVDRSTSSPWHKLASRT